MVVRSDSHCNPQPLLPLPLKQVSVQRVNATLEVMVCPLFPRTWLASQGHCESSFSLAGFSDKEAEACPRSVLGLPDSLPAPSAAEVHADPQGPRVW